MYVLSKLVVHNLGLFLGGRIIIIVVILSISDIQVTLKISTLFLQNEIQHKLSCSCVSWNPSR